MEKLSKIIFVLLILFGAVKPSAGQTLNCSCEALGESYFCSFGKTQEEARKNLAKNIYTFIKSKSVKKVSKNRNGYTKSYRGETLTLTELPLIGVSIKRCNGYYIAFISKADYRNGIKTLYLNLVKSIKTASSFKQIEEIKEQLFQISKVGALTGVKLPINLYYETLNEKYISLTKAAIKDTELKLNEYILLVSENRMDFDQFNEKVTESINNLKKLKEKVKSCKECTLLIDTTITNLSSGKHKVYEKLPGKITIFITKGEGTIYVNGERKGNAVTIEDLHERDYSIKVEGYRDYETRVFTVKVKKGREIKKEIKLWNFEKTFNRSVKIGFSSSFNTGYLEYHQFFNFKNVPLFKLFWNISAGHSFSRSGTEIRAGLGLKLFRKNEKEFLWMAGNKVISISTGVFIGYYGFNDKEDASFSFVRPFLSFELGMNEYFGIEAGGFYQNILGKDEEINPPHGGIFSSCNIYF
ncbi:hypothetical protein [Desulfurobacterium atlanticum]|uniref:PEGA domain-containing protein n=1 Tax=Desulfurobacterium atlanticum TaxID=240169 RepID=A0A238ZCE0_9BACT|nr:hypothetical protein [Desulfurobacterium atlanticum]SNR80433.1 hypothetical protein SAMN06265340_10780 [Desulfurobacterium atlanticum]